METKYRPKKVVFHGGPLDGKEEDFQGWCKYLLGPGGSIYLWRDDVAFQAAVDGCCIHTVNMMWAKDLSLADMAAK